MLSWGEKNSTRIANHNNGNFDDDFQDDIFVLERHGSIYNIIDEQNMIENIEQLQDDMHIIHDDIHEYAA